jgi:hypothetical protein
MLSIWGCATKKELESKVGTEANQLFQETSMFGNEYKGDGRYPVVGPAPMIRKWYATVTVAEGKVAKVE